MLTEKHLTAYKKQWTRAKDYMKRGPPSTWRRSFSSGPEKSTVGKLSDRWEEQPYAVVSQAHLEHRLVTGVCSPSVGGPRFTPS